MPRIASPIMAFARAVEAAVVKFNMTMSSGLNYRPPRQPITTYAAMRSGVLTHAVKKTNFSGTVDQCGRQ